MIEYNPAWTKTKGHERYKRSIDMIISQAVLEHISLNTYGQTIQQIYRVLKRSGFFSNEIDLRDHLDNSLNNLRFSRPVWESNLFRNSGFYTNRLRMDDHCEYFDRHFVDYNVKIIKQWKDLPISIEKLNILFQDKTPEVLKVAVFEAVLKK